MKNIFDGNSWQVCFARAIYKRIKSRDWFSYADIMTDIHNKGSAKDLP